MAEVRLVHAFVDVPFGEQAGSRKSAAESVGGPTVAEANDLLPAEQDLLVGNVDGTPALNHVSLVVHDGETVVIVGPSGCGKTTLLRSVAGLQPLRSGYIYIDGNDVTSLRPGDRGIGMVFQNFALYPHMMARGNLAFFFRVRHRESEIDERVKEVSRVLGVGFEYLLDRRPRQLSGGQQQRVAIGRCIIRDPSVFLFDEPLSNLDARLRQTTRVEIKRLLRRFNISSMYVTHDQTEAFALADRIAVMRRGQIEQVGTAFELRERPETLFVATFIGSAACSLFRGVVADGVLRVGDARFEGVPAARVHSGQVVVGIRSSDFELRTEPGPDTLTGVIQQVQRIPSERYANVQVRAYGRTLVAKLDRDIEFVRGNQIVLSAIAHRILLFDAQDGRRLVSV